VTVWQFAILAAAWAIWVTPFVLARKQRQTAQKVDRRARWGILLVGIGYALVWQGPFWERTLPFWRIPAALVFFVPAGLLAWTAPRALGRQWRIDAGLNADHQLVTSGPYRLVRHPIYTSMLCMLAGTGLLIAPLPLLAIGLLLFLAGTEIRVRVEESLLASRFAGRFDEYRRRVPAYIPFLR
jgi:protein-S-isoprenylcysteine O-methyltransferase Ste14